MKQLLFFVLFFSFTFNSHAYDHIEDALNETQVSHALRKMKFEESIWDQSSMYVPTFTDPSQWSGLNTLEQTFREWAAELILDNDLKTKAVGEMRKNLLFLYELEAEQEDEVLDESSIEYCNNITPFELAVGMSVFALNGHILVMQIYVEGDERGSYSQPHNSLSYSELHYFDLNTGKVVDQSTFFEPSKTKELLKIVKKKIPKEASIHLDGKEDFLSQPVFSGASFCFILTGSTNGGSESSYNFHARFSLEEIQPFLKKDGGFAPYLSLKKELPSTPTQLHLLRFERENHWYQKDYFALLDAEYLIEESVNPGTNSARYYIDKVEGDHLVLFAEYDRKGRITSKVNYEYSSTETVDSLLYFYHPNGNLKRIEYYDIQWDDDTTYRNVAYHFSEEGNLTSMILVDDDWSEFIDYFYEEHITVSYFKDKAVLDGYITSPMGTGIESFDIGPFDLSEGYEILRYDKGKNEFITPREISKNRLFEERIYLKRDTISMDLNVENNRVIGGIFSTKSTLEITVKYDENGKPLSYLHMNKTVDRGHSYEVSRDEFGKVITYEKSSISQGGSRTRVFKIVYDGSNP